MLRVPSGCLCCGGGLDGLLAAGSQGSAWLSGRGQPIGRRGFVAAGVAAAGLGAGLAAQPAAATVFSGGTILTVDRRFAEAEAVAIRGNRILAVGSAAEVRQAAGPDAALVDLAGRTMLPGFVDPHTHAIAGAAVDRIMDNVGAARFRTAAEVLAHLRSRVAATPPGEWVLARNFDPALQDGPDALTFAELDAVSAEAPVFVLNASGHLAYANRAAFRAAGVPEDVPDPPGAEFVRDPAGRLTGAMKNNVAFLRVLSAAPAMGRLDPVEALIGLLAQWGRVGLTTVSELSLGTLTRSPKDAAVMAAAAASGRLTARIRAYPFYTIEPAAWDAAGIGPGGGDPLARVAGFKLVADGSNQGFTGLQREPYLNATSRGTAYMTTAEMTSLALDRGRRGWPLALHANGDAGIDMVLDACAALRDAGIDLGRIRPRIEHCSMLHDDQIARMRDLGVSASFLIGHVHFWGIWMRDRVFGPDRVRHLNRARSVETAGVGFTLHSDFPVTDPVPLHMIEMAVTRRTWREPGVVLNPDERISVESAIRAITSEAAWQLFSEHEIGSIEAGKLADLVILERDPRRVEPDAIGSIRVLETWMDGRRVHPA
ncbi:amidohydrolase [Elioraea sp.]|jgi:predicted amidohydrolase YtcJ|uniref:amidohydrolase n=1 Tax=Elioraea sp. TaxID=2185103 RepID=UPI0021DCAFED|nr:amidohydrolase [Elioraea sp.]GIX12009.1 MAG: amidohydrolase [Elioraea sp.]